MFKKISYIVKIQKLILKNILWIIVYYQNNRLIDNVSFNSTSFYCFFCLLVFFIIHFRITFLLLCTENFFATILSYILLQIREMRINVMVLRAAYWTWRQELLWWIITSNPYIGKVLMSSLTIDIRQCRALDLLFATTNQMHRWVVYNRQKWINSQVLFVFPFA